MPNYEDYSAGLTHYNQFMRPIYASALRQLNLPSGLGLDVGCGIGGLFPFLPRPFIGYDRSRPHLTRARSALPIPLVEGNLHDGLPFCDACFAWVWASDALLMHQFPDPWTAVAELTRVTRAGGRVAIFFEHSFRGVFFPGRPHLEAIFQRALYQLMPPRTPQYHADNAHIWLAQNGLYDIQLHAHSALYRAPLSPAVRHYLTHTVFGWLRDDHLPAIQAWGIRPHEWRELQDAVHTQSPHFVLNDPHYYCVRLATVASGTKAGL